MSDLSWLNPTPHAIAVYASRPLSPVTMQHSLPSGRYALLGPDFHRLDRTSLRLGHPLKHFVSASPQLWWHRTTESVWPSMRSCVVNSRTRSTLALFEHFQCPVGVHGHYQLAADHLEHGQVGIDHERCSLQRHHRNPPPDPELACDHLIAVR